MAERAGFDSCPGVKQTKAFRNLLLHSMLRANKGVRT